MQFVVALLSALALAVSTTATPVHVAERSELIVVRPPLTEPVQGDTWPIGTNQTVCWDTSEIPPIAQNYMGTVYLGYYVNGTSSENLYIDNPLAKGFLLTDGSVSVTVPQVPSGDSYFVVLVGDSDNKSGTFSIVPQE